MVVVAGTHGLYALPRALPRPGLRQSPYHLNSHIRHETSAPVAFLFLAVRDGLTRKRGLDIPFPFVPHLPHPISWITSRR